jgi:ferredoxin
MTYVHVDRDKCEGFGFCEQAAPEVFRLDDDGVLSVDQSAAAGSAPAVAAALRVCPVAALRAGDAPAPADE